MKSWIFLFFVLLIDLFFCVSARAESINLPIVGGGGGSPGGSSGALQYNTGTAFGGFGTWSGTNLSFGSMFLHGDGSIGNGSSQNATNSTAIGAGASGLYGAVASGSTSLAVGFETVASGTNSIALGVGDSPGSYPTQATANYSLAIGYDTNSTAQFAVGVGPEVVAGGQNSFAAALGASTSGADGIAIGHSAVSALDGLAIGREQMLHIPNLLQSEPGQILKVTTASPWDTMPWRDRKGWHWDLRQTEMQITP